ncbi:hypothetical protein [Oricola nitratireducens]|uniref:hypothetical protein n=1 Tax=Oricola nitratireducens TaxID=2775868 RepID=UPI00186662EC|nr:hypothetical protein [Oricola nitratireducens]
MNKFAKTTLAALAFGILGAAPAAADYSIVTDRAFPSVVYIEYDPSTLPQVYTAPGGAGAGLGVIRGGQADGVSGAPATQTSGQTSSTGNKQQAAPMSLDERAQKKVEDLMNSGPGKIENMIIDRQIEDQVLKDVDING